MQYRFDFSDVLGYWPQFLHGAWLTIQLSFGATVLGFVLGTLCAVARGSRVRWLNMLAGVYVEGIRNTPLLVQVFLMYFGFASIGLAMPATVAAVITLIVNVGAYTTEIMRAGIESVHPGQIEAAECLGMSTLQIYWHIILRPAMERVYPALTSQFVLLMLATSITSQISAEELTAVANLVQSMTYRAFEAYIVTALFYLLLSLLMRAGFWLLGLIIFPRQRKLGTPA
ncbi:amino acid ABC transporter permease [Pollutimonas bauzanensis]|uniref:Amino acid ABC transporter membrane protein 1, PAAT family (TC 3.A.1.3.-) n=1 Tax=Pollutimonas bauzanensis TaxID=658167 RepID=A0A1M5ZIP9_9BURK|nr:amino acid ABC transporter permease [Pollutimonas bauzanensis]SHI24177.1 amino acid ABC transporter membrane protein 1, PAAT family (TC 3.A.1.3.-) [Pollutimonas bauzanensis]